MTVGSAMHKAANTFQLYFGLFGARGVVMRALCGACGTSNVFSAHIPHTSKNILLRLGTTDVAAFEHVFVHDEYGFTFARPPSVIVDAGANVGMSSVYFALRYPDAKIVAIEPEASNFEVLRRNAELFPKIIPVNAALWSHDGVVQMQDGGGGHWGMRVADAPSGAATRATTIPSLIARLGLGHIDLLKIDVEGAECEIFADASPWIGRVGVICAEMHDRFRPGCSKIFETATAEFPVKWRRGELHCVAHDGLIAAPN